MPDQTDLFASLLKSKYVTSNGTHKIRIEFDGGTPCNIPSRGYGIGYGSYQLQNCNDRHIHHVQRLNFGVSMSANVAEITTLIRAIKSVVKAYNPENTILEIHGDSKIALNRCLKRVSEVRRVRPMKPFDSACEELFALCAQFKEVKPLWRGRTRSVEVFGH